ncbi:glycosyl hydrolase [Vagococcus martis]|uniref:Glycosyl hydrolase n=1 Tax=Vagococcus martis TaxID=1768210 RepID=A0A1V4DKA7_9ENTE|nr:glycoside hydrolase family 3 C-terminal domain-containing protein [Vagococcus martis]OPF88893.1 glycosyl hydrolase [Vagococcus martis]
MTFDSNYLQALTLEEKAAIVTGMNYWYTHNIDEKNIPSIMVTDGPSGLRKQADKGDALGLNDSVEAISFPTASLTASSFDKEMLYQLGKQLGQAANAEGVSILLGPGVNIKRNPLAGRNFEYFSEDPYVAGTLGAAYVNGVQSTGTGVSVKHFAANNRENQRFTSSSNIDERALREIYLPAFEHIVKQAYPETLMCSYNKLNGELVSQNKRLLTDILRNEWGFEGLVMSDWGAVANRTKSLQAGMDLEMPGRGDISIDDIVSSVQNGNLEESVLDQSVLRVLKLVDKHKTTTSVKYDKEAQHAFARCVAANSFVLLKNENQTLPIDKKDSILIVGELADKPRFQGGGSSHVNAYNVVSPLEAATNLGLSNYAKGYSIDKDVINEADIKEAINKAKEVDKIVLFAGLPAYLESEGFDKTTNDLPQNQIRLIDELSKLNKPIIMVLQNGSAINMPWVNDASAILETYLGGEAIGEATWDVLTGDVNPSGKLAETFPVNLSDTPSFGTFNASKTDENYHESIFVGYRYYDLKQLDTLFPFGHGLSYTTFNYSNISVKEENQSVVVTFTIKNTGSVAGADVAQVYVSNQTSNIEKPVKELREFEKVFLQPGKEKTISIALNRRAFSWYNADRKAWQVDNGQYDIFVGSSSRDIKLSEAFQLTFGTDIVESITPDSYLSQIIDQPNPVVTDALKKTGIYEAIQTLLTNNKRNIELLENIPLRSMAMMGITDEKINEFLKLIK